MSIHSVNQIGMFRHASDISSRGSIPPIAWTPLHWVPLKRELDPTIYFVIKMGAYHRLSTEHTYTRGVFIFYWDIHGQRYLYRTNCIFYALTLNLPLTLPITENLQHFYKKPPHHLVWFIHYFHDLSYLHFRWRERWHVWLPLLHSVLLIV